VLTVIAPDYTTVIALAQNYSTVTLFARFLGLSTLHPRKTAAWYASSCNGTTLKSGCKHSGASGMYTT
jgi:hypothetical protein